ncbi:MAG: transglycosylase SLT domain-containing protein [Nannocystaceae bacterium]
MAARVAALLPLIALLGGLGGAQASARADEPAAGAIDSVGPLQIAYEGRDRVRGGRPEGSTIHEAYVPRPVEPEAAERAELDSFERRELPPTAALHRPPPEAWLRELTLPDIPVRWSEATIAYLRYFRDDPKGQGLIRGWIKRMGRYERRVRAILREVGVPEDLAFVAMAESGFIPHRRSRVGAAGMWQFMAGTGGVYGLQRSFWVDERLDVERSTYAAAAYLKDLRARFGSWEMALAAYNGGYGLVLTSVSRYNTNNFWALCEIESGLPQATTRYIPKIIAAAIVGRNREAFAVDRRALEALPAVEWDEVMVPARTSIEAVAKLLDEDPALLAELNAQYVRGRVPPDGELHPVRVPAAKKQLLQRSQGRLLSEAEALSTTVVRLGETAKSVAARVGTQESTLRRLNGIEDNGELARDVVLVYPGRSKPALASKGKAAAEGEGRPLAAVPAVVVGPGERLVFFSATRSTTPRGLAEAFAVSWESIVAWNDLDPQARIQPGQILQVIVGADFQADAERVVIYEPDEVDHVIRGASTHLDASLERRGLVRRGYKVRSGDTLEKIGTRFKLSVGDLARINDVPRGHKPGKGDVLVVYVAKGKTKGTIRAPEPAPTSTVDAAAQLDDDAADSVSAPAQASAKPPKPAKTTPSRRQPTSRPASTPATNKLPGRQGWSR